MSPKKSYWTWRIMHVRHLFVQHRQPTFKGFRLYFELIQSHKTASQTAARYGKQVVQQQQHQLSSSRSTLETQVPK
ncbi:Protein of unknown function [Pyronema omphalodes CBS 100304]|uniref:Uncharacterized protein n=1 Tax=Pyronema omphalodes (strain CBS 100304) TaxID=1076935 RepID=U4LDN4_PYROM|nr:Protein of unknown function [Pyronema omphalodes CBS 100304]